jgi:hypothetical protein
VSTRGEHLERFDDVIEEAADLTDPSAATVCSNVPESLWLTQGVIHEFVTIDAGCTHSASILQLGSTAANSTVPYASM